MPEPTQGQKITAIHSQLSGGNLAAAQELLKQLADETNAAEVAAGVQAAQPTPVRTPDQVVRDLFGKLVAQMGNHPQLEALIAELDTSIEHYATKAEKVVAAVETASQG